MVSDVSEDEFNVQVTRDDKWRKTMAILHTNIGICKWKTYLYDDAKKEFEKAVNRDHTYEKAQKWLKYYEDF